MKKTVSSSKLKGFPPLLTRISVGFVFAQTGWGKLHNLGKVTQFFTELGIPAPALQAQLVAAMEFGCGLFLILGLLTRLAWIPLAVIMCVALVTAKRSDISDISDLFGLSEYLYIVLLIWLGVFGAGRFSLDHYVFKKTREKN